MNYFKEHLQISPFDRYVRSEWSESLLILYKVLGWAVRDQADELVIAPNRFRWSRQGTLIRKLDAKGLAPEGGYPALMRLVMRRDAVVRANMEEVFSSSPEALVYHFRLSDTPIEDQ